MIKQSLNSKNIKNFLETHFLILYSVATILIILIIILAIAIIN